jgi:hypothetical protein
MPMRVPIVRGHGNLVSRSRMRVRNECYWWGSSHDPGKKVSDFTTWVDEAAYSVMGLGQSVMRPSR